MQQRKLQQCGRCVTGGLAAAKVVVVAGGYRGPATRMRASFHRLQNVRGAIA
jgi:hypothetical protein